MLKRPGPVSSRACQEQKCGFREWGPRGRWLGIAAFLGVVVVAAAVPLLALPGPGFSSVAPQETVSSQGGAAVTAPPSAVIQTPAPERAPYNQGTVDRTSPPPPITQQELLSALLRYGARPEGSSPAFFPAVDVLLATPDYFSQTSRQPPTLPSGEPSLIFYVAEHVHIDELPESPPGPLLRVGETYWQPTEITMLTNSPHHRMTLIRYRAKRAGGEPLITSEVPSIELVFPPAAGNTIPPSILTWELPIAYNPTYSSKDLYILPGS